MSQDSRMLSSMSSSRTTSLKMVVVGNEGVGKTSFVRRFIAEELGIAVEEVIPTASSLACSSSSPSPAQNNRWPRQEGSPEIKSTDFGQNPEVGLDIYEMKLSLAKGASSLDNTYNRDCENRVNVNVDTISIWDFTGKAENLHAIEEMFFTPQTLYVIVWDMAARDITPMECKCVTMASATLIENDTNRSANDSTGLSRLQSYSKSHRNTISSSFKLGYDSDSEGSNNDYHSDCDVDMFNQEELRATKRRLERDIDKKVQFWIDQIQSVTPGATILPIATHIDRLGPHTHPLYHDKEIITHEGGVATTSTTRRREYQWKEVRNRCRLLKNRIFSNESRKLEVIERNRSLQSYGKRERSSSDRVPRPVFEFGNVQEDGEVLPHTVAASGNGTEDKKKGESNVSLGMNQSANFADVREFIFSAARAASASANEEDKRKEEPSRCRENSIGLHESRLVPPLASDKRCGTSQCKIIQTDYFKRNSHNCCGRRRDQNLLLPADQKYSIKDRNKNVNCVPAGLDSLHGSGKLCYFGSNTILSRKSDRGQPSDVQLLSHFVILDPTWLVESIDFILRYARKLVETNPSNSTYATSSKISKDQRATNCPTIEKKKVRSLWKNRHTTKEGLAFAARYSRSRCCNNGDKNYNDIASKVYEFIQCLLVRHEVFVPLSYQKADSRHYFVPGLLEQKDTSELRTLISVGNTLTTPPPSVSSSTLAELSPSSGLESTFENRANLRANLDFAQIHTACHGLLFVDTTPQFLMERVIVRMMKALDDILNPTCGPRVIAREIYCWKDSFRLKLQLKIGGEGKEKTEEREVYCFLVEASEGDAYSRIAACESVLATYFQGCFDCESHDIWRHTCSRLRLTIQNSLDEMHIEYREEAICPECLRNKPVNEIGTWTHRKLRSAANDNESFIRCRHGHRIETKVDAYLHCQLRADLEQNLRKYDIVRTRSPSKSRRFSSTPVPLSQSNTTATLTKKHFFRNESCSKGTKPYPLSISDISDDEQFNHTLATSATQQHLWNATKTNRSRFSFSSGGRRVLLSSSSPNKVETSSKIDEGSNEAGSGSLNDREDSSRLKLASLFEQCEAKMKRLFFKKSYLSLENLNMTECQIPVKDLIGTKFGHDLKSLSLAHNELETIPKSLVQSLPNLRSINLSHCLIYELPKRWNLRSLKKLNISHNLLMAFPEESMLLGLLALEELNLSGNKLTEVEVSRNPEILRNLVRLDLSSNELTSFPRSLDRLTSLKSLDIEGNNIRYE